MRSTLSKKLKMRSEILIKCQQIAIVEKRQDIVLKRFEITNGRYLAGKVIILTLLLQELQRIQLLVIYRHYSNIGMLTMN